MARKHVDQDISYGKGKDNYSERAKGNVRLNCTSLYSNNRTYSNKSINAYGFYKTYKSGNISNTLNEIMRHENEIQATLVKNSLKTLIYLNIIFTKSQKWHDTSHLFDSVLFMFHGLLRHDGTVNKTDYPQKESADGKGVCGL